MRCGPQKGGSERRRERSESHCQRVFLKEWKDGRLVSARVRVVCVRVCVCVCGRVYGYKKEREIRSTQFSDAGAEPE